jgi:hypothetical protein
MNWFNLIEDKCPKCNSLLFTNKYEPGTGVNCSSIDSCDFFITQEKFQELKKTMTEKRQANLERR